MRNHCGTAARITADRAAWDAIAVAAAEGFVFPDLVDFFLMGIIDGLDEEELVFWMILFFLFQFFRGISRLSRKIEMIYIVSFTSAVVCNTLRIK